MINNTAMIISLICATSIIFNVVLMAYARRVLTRVLNASEEASEIFTRLDTFQEHLTSVYEMPTFYGDETLKGLLEHAKETSDFLSRYEEVYSFTQPDLLEQLEAASKELEEKYEQEEAASEEE